MLPSLPRLAAQPFVSLSLKKQYAGLGFLAAAVLPAPLFAAESSGDWPHPASSAALNRQKLFRISTPPLASIGAQGSGRIKLLMRGVERLARLFLLEQVGDDVAAG